MQEFWEEFMSFELKQEDREADYSRDGIFRKGKRALKAAGLLGIALSANSCVTDGDAETAVSSESSSSVQEVSFETDGSSYSDPVHESSSSEMTQPLGGEVEFSSEMTSSNDEVSSSSETPIPTMGISSEYQSSSSENVVEISSETDGTSSSCFVEIPY
jgi:hypothetical protein